MRDPYDDRPDAYALLNCTPASSRAEIQRSFTRRLVERAASQAELQAAREILVSPAQRLVYDLLTYDAPIAGSEARPGSEDNQKGRDLQSQDEQTAVAAAKMRAAAIAAEIKNEAGPASAPEPDAARQGLLCVMIEFDS